MKGFFPRRAVSSPIAVSIVLVCLFSSMPAFSTAMTKDAVEQYFAALKKDFDKVADNPVMKIPKSKSVNGLFLMALKRHQPVYSFMRTNAKGVMVNEVVRGQIPEKGKKNVKEKNAKEQNVKDQEWFKKISKTATEYYGFTFIEENGRYYLFWVNPILDKKKRFCGAVVAKIDLWDCFHEMSKETTEPFLIRLGGKSLYSDKWKNAKTMVDVPLEVAGVEKISLITEKPIAAAAAAAAGSDTSLSSYQKDTGAVAAVAPALFNDTLAKKKSAGGFFAKNKVLIIICGIVILILFIFLLVRFYIWLSNIFAMRNINKPDEDPFGRR
jgi:hypothetical protein